MNCVSDLPPPRLSDLPGAPGPLRPVVALAAWLGRMYVAVGSLGALTAASLVNRARVLDTVASEGGAADISRSLRSADAFVAMSSALLVFCALAVFVLLIVWTWRMDRNMRTLGTPPRLPGAVAIAGWFIPVVNLVVPFVFVRDFVRGLGSSALRRGDRFRATDYSVASLWWFGQFAVLLLSGAVEDERSAANLSDFSAADRTTAAGFAVFAASALFGVVTFRRFARDSFDHA